MFSIVRQYQSDYGTNRSKSQPSCMYVHDDFDNFTSIDDPYREESDTQYEIAQLTENLTKVWEEDSQQREIPTPRDSTWFITGIKPTSRKKDYATIWWTVESKLWK